jgi:hypothetical protein
MWGLNRLKRIVGLIVCYVRRWSLPHRRHHVCITKTNNLMLFMQIAAVYFVVKCKDGNVKEVVRAGVKG